MPAVEPDGLMSDAPRAAAELAASMRARSQEMDGFGPQKKDWNHDKYHDIRMYEP